MKLIISLVLFALVSATAYKYTRPERIDYTPTQTTSETQPKPVEPTPAPESVPTPTITPSTPKVYLNPYQYSVKTPPNTQYNWSQPSYSSPSYQPNNYTAPTPTYSGNDPNNTCHWAFGC